jgi:hypothetical protein
VFDSRFPGLDSGLRGRVSCLSQLFYARLSIFLFDGQFIFSGLVCLVALVLICSERKILLAGTWWLLCSERKVLVADKPSEQGCAPGCFMHG